MLSGSLCLGGHGRFIASYLLPRLKTEWPINSISWWRWTPSSILDRLLLRVRHHYVDNFTICRCRHESANYEGSEKEKWMRRGAITSQGNRMPRTALPQVIGLVEHVDPVRNLMKTFLFTLFPVRIESLLGLSKHLPWRWIVDSCSCYCAKWREMKLS